MQELLEKPKSEFLLDGSLELLHQENKVWLNEALLWKDEIRFFKNLIHKKVLEEYADSKSSKLWKEHHFFLKEFETAIDQFYDEWLSQFLKLIYTHDNLLAGVLQNRRGDDDQSYREKHHNLRSKFEGLRKELVKLKLHLFRYIENMRKV